MTHPAITPLPSTSQDGRWTLTRGTALVAVVIALAGCASAGAAPNTSPDPSSTSPSAAAAERDWPVVDEAGTGPTTLTISRPSPEAFYLMANFSCTTGESMVELQEDLRVFMGGPCGPGGNSYQMPLPADITELHFTIDIDEGSDFTFSGTFMPRG